jgi:hypothetical protein
MKAEDILPDDVNLRPFGDLIVRKGTVAAFLANPPNSHADASAADERAAAERDLLDALPALGALGIFDVLEVRDPRLRALIGR